MTPKDEQGEWVFDTVKSVAPPPKRPTVKQHRKPSSIFNAEEAMKKLDVKDGPLGGTSPAPGTVRKSTVRRSSVAQDTTSTRPSGSPRGSIAPKRPLQTDMSFGNSGSTMRLFRRVPSDSSSQGGRPTSSDDVFCDENSPPATNAPVEPYGKEAVLGRRLYVKAVEPSLAELHAQTSAMQKREALAKLSDAFAALDAVDPEGAYHLMTSMVSSMAQDNKLSASILRQPVQKIPDDGTPQGTVIVKGNTPAASPAKLVMASSNPHLRSHRRRHADTPTMYEKDFDREKLAIENKYPGQEARSGMEHCKQLSDVLYSRWSDGLRIRWPAV